MKISFFLSLLFAVFLAFLIPASAQTTMDRELHNKGFNTLFAAVKAAGLEEKLRDATALTFFAPNDNAFRYLPKAEVDALFADKAKLAAILTNHLVEGTKLTDDLKGVKLKTLGGTEISVKAVDGKLKVNAAVIVKPDVKASNGVIQGIDAILMP